MSNTRNNAQRQPGSPDKALLLYSVHNISNWALSWEHGQHIMMDQALPANPALRPIRPRASGPARHLVELVWRRHISVGGGAASVWFFLQRRRERLYDTGTIVSIFGENPHSRPARAPAGPLRRRTGLGGGGTAAAAAATAATATAAAAASLVATATATPAAAADLVEAAAA